MKITVDASKLRKVLAARNVAFLKDVRSRWAKGSEEFISLIQRTQMTGRPGLNVRTGLLRKTWFEDTNIVDGADVQTKIYSGVKYSRIHEYGGTIKIPARKALLTMQTRRTKYGLFGMKAGGNRFAKPRIDKATGHLKKNQRQKLATIGAHTITIPQRLHVRDSWKKDGQQILMTALSEAMKTLEGGSNVRK